MLVVSTPNKQMKKVTLNHLVIFHLNQKSPTKHIKYGRPSVANLSSFYLEPPVMTPLKEDIGFGELNHPVNKGQLDFHKKH